jgi:hypothetical protein
MTAPQPNIGKLMDPRGVSRSPFDRASGHGSLVARLLLVFVVLLAGLGIASNIGGYVTKPLPVRWVDIPVFPNTPLVQALTRHGSVAENVNYDIILATPEFFESVGRSDEILYTGAYFSVVFVLVEYHYHDGLHTTFSSTMTIDGTRYSRPIPMQLSDDGHNRVTALQFPELPSSMLNEPHTFSIPLPPNAQGEQIILEWVTPLTLPAATNP